VKVAASFVSVIRAAERHEVATYNGDAMIYRFGV
jgi:hypothetical protein